MYDYTNNGAESNLSQPLSKQPTPSATPGEENESKASGTQRIGRRHSSVRLIPVNDVDESTNDRQSDNLAHSKSEMRRRNSLMMHQQFLMQRQQQLMMAQPGQQQQQQCLPSTQGDMNYAHTAPMQQKQPPPYVRQAVRRGTNISADAATAAAAPPPPPPQRQQQQKQAPPSAVRENAKPRNATSSLSGPPAGLEVRRRGSQLRPEHKAQPRQQPPSRVGRDAESGGLQSARRQSVLAEKAKLQNYRRTKSEKPTTDVLSDDDADKETPPPPRSFTKRLKKFFTPTTTHRRRSKEEEEEEEEEEEDEDTKKRIIDKKWGLLFSRYDEAKKVKEKNSTDAAKTNQRRGKSGSVSPVAKLSAVEEVAHEDPNEKALEELDDVLAKREKASMKRTKSVRRTQSFFGDFSHKAADDDDENEDGGYRQVSSPSPSVSDSSGSSDTPENSDNDNNNNFRSVSVSSEQGKKEAGNLTPISRAGSEEDDRDNAYTGLDTGSSDEDGRCSTNSSSSSVSDDDGEQSSSSPSTCEDSDEERMQPRAKSFSPTNNYKPSPFLEADVSQTSNGEYPPTAKPSEISAGESARQQWSAGVAGMAPIPSIDTSRPQSMPQQLQKRVSMIYPANSMPRQVPPSEGFTSYTTPPPVCNAVGMLSNSVPPPNAAMVMNAQRSFMMNPNVTPMMMRYPMAPQGYPIGMQPTPQQQQIQRRQS